MRALALLAALGLAACATPQQSCVNSATRDYRRAQEQAGTAEANLARGYALVEQEVSRDRWVLCDAPDPFDAVVGRTGKKAPRHRERPRLCLEEDDYTIARRVPVSPARERAVLAAARDTMRLLRPATERAVAQCRAQFPR